VTHAAAVRRRQARLALSGALFRPRLNALARTDSVRILYFYYSQHCAYRNQLRGVSHPRRRSGEAQLALAGKLEALVGRGGCGCARQSTLYLKRPFRLVHATRSAAGSTPPPRCRRTDPLTRHRLSSYGNLVIRAFACCASGPIVVNTPTCKAIPDFTPEDVVEVPCRITPAGVERKPWSASPGGVRGTGAGREGYERQTIEAAVHFRGGWRAWPFPESIAGEWDTARRSRARFFRADAHLGYLKWTPRKAASRCRRGPLQTPRIRLPDFAPDDRIGRST